jgi:FKBP-type peptidyl-prolyl cis-trans isomerase
MTNKFSLSCILALCIAVVSCRNPEQNHKPEQPVMSNAELKESLINESRRRMREEVSRIDNWIERNNLQMISTETGVRYRILQEGKGPLPSLLSRVKLDYTLALLDGTQCYSSDSTGSLNFILGQSSEPSGLQEILLKLHEGTTAQIIVPSYLGYGLTGDGDCISGDESLLYEVKLLQVKQN